MRREIVKFGSRLLRQKCVPVEQVDDDIRALVPDLFDSMSAAEGVGLAAPQIGVLRRVVVIDVSRQEPAHPPLALINPRVIRAQGEQLGEEGCLSFPDLYGEVRRHAQVQVEALDLEGRAFTTGGESFYARALQHEIDHLDGKLFIDHLSPLKRQLMRGALRRLKKEGETWDREHLELVS
jgi:peptide deformylase